MARLNRFRLQYSLRSLLLFVLAASAFMAWFGAKYRAACRQRVLLAAIGDCGAHYEYDYQYRAEEEEHDPDPPAPAWARKLLGDDFFADVAAVWYDPLSVAPRRMPTTVQTMDRLLDNLRSLAKLEELDLEENPVTDEGLRNLAGLTRLRKLGLRLTRVSDAGMPHLAKLVRLEALYLAETRVTGAGLGSLRGLRRLYLSHAGVTDAGLNDIGELRHLELLCVDGTDVTDAGLDRLKGLAKLRELDISDTRATAEGVAKLQRALPKCKISNWPTDRRRQETRVNRKRGTGGVIDVTPSRPGRNTP